MGCDDDFLSLIDRLQKCSELKYPERKWVKTFYDGMVFVWKDKKDQLKERVLKLESEIDISHQT